MFRSQFRPFMFMGALLLLATLLPVQAVNAQSAGPDGSVAYSASHGGKSRPFSLSAGDYVFDWSSDVSSDYFQSDNCIVELHAIGRTHISIDNEYLLNVIVDVRDGGQNYLYGLEDGTYYLDVLGCGKYNFTISAL